MGFEEQPIIFRTYATGTLIFWFKSQQSRGATAVLGFPQVEQVAFKGQKFKFFGLLTLDSGQPKRKKCGTWVSPIIFPPTTTDCRQVD
ncbi:hypothetical protein FDUTEX481_07673 [Tolypothrix sp. PCC 7601]|nr:hypothetical protein FDUTEX481_07673 [Tolypothrix sp. PCC 7601]